ncbi:unnamed protein product [Lactuca saligna]|uniref:GTP diphosphokinase n=1 Tax=Lactuca saligna TaxID=75948 RepID=A0AA35YYM3_LACSI|nr:unnamed protein product [Lactuca saligna]
MQKQRSVFVDDPRVVLIKLADRLHNMRTIYALPSGKAKAVAQDTLVIWCSLASRLGHWALKAELEDLCFAVLQPQIFQQMRSDLASLWTPSNSSSRVGNLRRLSAKSSSNPEYEASTEDVVVSMKDLLQAVIPFDLLLDRRKRFGHQLMASLTITLSIQSQADISAWSRKLTLGSLNKNAEHA